VNIVGFEKHALARRLAIAFTFGLLAFAIDTGVQTAFNRTAPATVFRVSDFGVVYCGAQVVRGHGDPYLTEPLRSCERRVYAPTTEPAWKVSPAPLPGYALAAVVPLAFLPFGVAKMLWIALSLAALCVTDATLAAIADRPTVAVMLILTPTVGVLNLRYGEPVPFAIAALCIAAWYMQRRSPRSAAIAAAFAMLEPHVGLPAVVGLFVLVPATRWTLVAMGSGLAAISLATLGLHTNLEYFTAFLPAQAKAELIAVDQYSLSHALYLLGMRPQAALALGSISYLAAIGIGVLAARRVVARTELPALAVLVPVAIAMLGGPFIHDVEIASAVPAAIVLARGRGSRESRSRFWSSSGLSGGVRSRCSSLRPRSAGRWWRFHGALHASGPATPSQPPSSCWASIAPCRSARRIPNGRSSERRLRPSGRPIFPRFLGAGTSDYRRPRVRRACVRRSKRSRHGLASRSYRRLCCKPMGSSSSSGHGAGV